MCGTFFGRGLCRQNPWLVWSMRSMELRAGRMELVDRRRLCSRLWAAFWFIHALPLPLRQLLLLLLAFFLVLLLLAALQRLLVISVALQKVCPKHRQLYGHIATETPGHWATISSQPPCNWSSQMQRRTAGSQHEWMRLNLDDHINESQWRASEGIGKSGLKMYQRGSECVPANILCTFGGPAQGKIISQDHTRLSHRIYRINYEGRISRNSANTL